MQPWLVHERMIRDLMTGISDGPQHRAIGFDGGVFADDEERDALAAAVERIQDARHDPV